MSFSELITEHVIVPLKLRRTFTLDSRESLLQVTPGYSTMFSASGSPQDVREVYHPGWCATGVVASTASELCRFFEGLFACQLLRPDSLAQMLQLRRVPGNFPPAVRPSYGLGLMGDPEARFGPEFGHGGGGPGFDLRSVHHPRFRGRRLSLAVLCTTDSGESAWSMLTAMRSAIATALDANGP